MQPTASTQPTATVPKAGRKAWIGLAVLALPTLLVSMDMTVMYLAIPAISVALKPGSAELLWITDIFGFFEGGLLITMGTVGDRIGTRKLLLTGSVLFTMASVLTAFSTSAAMLIAARALLGITAATLLPSTLSIIRNMFHNDRERTLAIGAWTTCFSAGTMLGPLIGGVLLHYFWWGAVFLMAVPVMILLLSLAPTLLPEFHTRHTGKLDIGSVVILIAATLTTMLGIKRMAEHGATVVPLLILAAGIFITITFVRRQRKLPEPLIDLSLFSNEAFNATLMALMIALFSWTGMLLFITQYLQLVIGLDPLKAGLWTMPGAAANIVLCIAAPVAVRYIQRRHLIAAGLALLACGILCLTTITDASGLPMLITATVLMSGCGLAVTLSTDLVVATAPPERAGAAAGISETSANLGSSIGIALLGSLATAIYRTRMVTLLPEAVPQHLARDIRSTLGGAVAASSQLPQALQQDVLTAARQAFIQVYANHRPGMRRPGARTGRCYNPHTAPCATGRHRPGGSVRHSFVHTNPCILHSLNDDRGRF